MASRSRFRRKLFAVVLAAVVGACPAAGGIAATLGRGSAGATDTSLSLDWVPNPDHVAVYYADKKGLFAKNGLKVALHVPSDPSAPVKLVGVKKADFAVSYEPEMFFAHDEGLPVTAIAAIIPVPLNSLVASPTSGIHKLSDLKGKSVGTTGIPSDEAILATAVKAAHLPAGAVKNVHVGFNLVPSLLAGRVDAIVGGYRNVERIQIQQETGKRVTYFPADKLGVPTYAELVLVANRDRLASDPAYRATARRLVKALVAAGNAARRHPAAATAIMRSVSQYKPAFLKVSVPYTLSLLRPPGKAVGCMVRSQWAAYAKWLKKSKLVKKTPNVSLAMTTRYLPTKC
jgi:putative hydroxymethylpyrimidine transport system substrate-binding protein